MASSSTSRKGLAVVRKDPGIVATIQSSRENSPAVTKSKVVANDNVDLTAVFKTDLTNIRSLVTCSVCDQLLYEPWTLACGHTYCYSCLCSWFTTNRRKKTCPECRMKVKQTPSPNFLVKQMVEIFTKRTELMPADESVDQHTKKRAEEMAAVDLDKNGPGGLFKGTFPERRSSLRMDYEDGVLRCPECGHEHEGGPECHNCGYEIGDDDVDPYDFSDMDGSDMDGEDLEDLELDLDLDDDVAQEFLERGGFMAHTHHHHFTHGGHPLHYFPHGPHHYHGPGRGPIDLSSEASDSEDGDAGSLDDFVVADDDSPQNRRRQNPSNEPITISDDESDEGGAVSNRRRRRAPSAYPSSPVPSVPSVSVLSVDDDATTNGSVAGQSEADMLRHAGWSPLDQETDSDIDHNGSVDYGRYDGYGGYGEDEQTSDSDTETETETLNGAEGNTDDEDEEGETPTYRPAYTYAQNHSFVGPVHGYINGFDPTSSHHDYDNSSDLGGSSVMDGDGDTEMSVSPRAHRGNRSTSVATSNSYAYREDAEERNSRTPIYSNPQYDQTDDEDDDTMHTAQSSFSENNPYKEEPELRESSVATNERPRGESLGHANEIHEVEDSSDGSIRPPVRRRRFDRNARVQQYDPRISMMFAEHQQTMRGTASDPIDLNDLEELGEVRRVYEHSSRNRRMTAYRNQPSRRVDPLRSSRSPSATRVVASSSRNPRHPRQYVRRSHM